MVANDYCLKCKQKTTNKKSINFITKNNRCLRKSNCVFCHSKKATFISLHYVKRQRR